MNDQAIFWLALTLLCIAVQAYFNMVEMAIISFNKVRLQYYVNKGLKRAVWIHSLIKQPARFFGTTLLGMTVSLQIGSECSRQFYRAIDINPDWAPLSQFFLVVIIAELAPIFAARRYAENVAMLGVPILYFSSKLMSPIVTLCALVAKGINRLIGGAQEEPDVFLSRDELQRVFEEPRDSAHVGVREDFNTIVANIFHLRNKIAKQVMTPLEKLKMVSSTSTVIELREQLAISPFSHIPVYHRYRSHIVAIASSRDLIRIPDQKRVRDYARPPWFIIERTTIIDLLKQFRHNNQDLAVVLDEKGQALGIISLEDILDEVFGENTFVIPVEDESLDQLVVERHFAGETTIEDFNSELHARLDSHKVKTLEEMMIEHLGHHPQKGESIRLDRFEFTVIESRLLGIKTISVRTIA